MPISWPAGRRLPYLLATVLSIAALGTCAFAQQDSVVPQRVLVKFRSSAPQAAIESALQEHGARQVGSIPALGVRILQITGKGSEVATAALLRSRSDVEFAEPDCIVQLQGADPLMGNQWHLNKISAPTAWNTTHGSPGVIVAVIDTGCDPTHPDLVSKYVPGWNFYDNNSNSADVYGHGTFVAGIAAAATNNDLGVAGVGYDCRIMPLRISSASGSGMTSLMANALVYAADHGARVANISYKVSGSSTVQAAAQRFMDRGGVVTIAAGNDGEFISSPDVPSVLTVAATTATDGAASWSSHGNIIDLGSPGENVYSTCRGGGYGNGSGTSFAAPIVAGAAALVISANPSLTGAQARDVMKASADDLGAAGWDPSFGWGRVNAARAVALAVAGGGGPDAQPPVVSFASPAGGGTVQGTTSVTVTAFDNSAVASVELFVNGVSAGVDTSGPYTWSWNTANTPNGPCTLMARARDAAGNASTASVAVTVQNLLDTIAPIVAVTNPANGAHLTKPVTIMATATDNVGVVRVEFYVDGVMIGSSSGPSYSCGWNPKKAPHGSHTIQARAFDAAGNSSWSAAVVVTN